MVIERIPYSSNSEIMQNFNTIIDFDNLQAKARFSISENATAPEIANDFSWDIRNGFHPILLNKLKMMINISLS